MAIVTEPPIVDRSSSMSLLSSGTDLFSMLGLADSVRDTDAPSSEKYVLCAVLDDADNTHVKLGSARFHPTSGTFQMLDGSLKIHQNSRSAEDGLYREPGGTYSIVREQEYKSNRREESAVSASAASPPRMKRQPSCSMSSPISTPLSVTPPSKTLLVEGSNTMRKMAPAPTGCSAHAETRTVVVSGNFEGDSKRLGVVMKQSSDIAIKAALHGNRVVYAFLGNVVPDVHGDSNSDSMKSILSMAESGIELNSSLSVRPEDVLLMIGSRELSWLRLANPDMETREISRFDFPDAINVLGHETPFAGMNGIKSLTSWSIHNNSLRLFPSQMTPNVLAVAMFLKLVSMTQMTMRAPGLVKAFAERLSKENRGDAVSYISLIDFLDGFDGTIQDGIEKLFDGDQLTPEGLGLMPASKDMVDAVLEFAENEVNSYMKMGSLINCVVNMDTSGGSGGLWLTPVGTHNGRIVGKLPAAVDESTLKIKWKRGPESKIEWKDAFNQKFHEFHDQFMNGHVDRTMYEVFVAMSISSHHDVLPVNNLRSSPTSSCQGVTASSSVPFGTVQRRILVDNSRVASKQSDLLSVLEKWNNINTDAYTPSTFWSISSWCTGTQMDIESGAPMLNLGEKAKDHLYNVSVTLASLLSTKVGGVDVMSHGIEGLNGLLGPALAANSGQRQAMRVVSFTHDKLDTAFVVLLPEAFVRHSVDYYNYNYEAIASPDAPMIAVEGFIALPDESAVPLDLPGLSSAEVSMLRTELGTRVWALPKKRSDTESAAFTSSDYASISVMETSEQCNREIIIPGYTILHTRQTDTDALSGINVGLAHVPGLARMTLDTDVTEYHSMFRVVAKSS